MANGSSPTLPFEDTYKMFLFTVKKGLKHRLGDTPEYQAVGAELLNAVINPLFEAAGDIRQSFFAELSPQAQEALVLELEFFNRRYAEDEGDDTDFTRDAQTVKESLEDLFGEGLKNTKWIQELLKILNELLKLVRG